MAVEIGAKGHTLNVFLIKKKKKVEFGYRWLRRGGTPESVFLLERFEDVDSITHEKKGGNVFI